MGLDSGPKEVWVWVLPCPDTKGFGLGSAPRPKGVGYGLASEPKRGLGVDSFLSGPKRGRCPNLRGLGLGSVFGPKGVGFGVWFRTQGGLGFGLYPSLSGTQIG